ncbi:MAG: hypothetical protein M3014_01090 [Chloroflexota bacterium]|nr:hypothetical protein [Chloroflexota bacterium]
MKSSIFTNGPRTLTLGELCEALVDRQLPAQVDDETYTFRKADLMLYFNARSAREPRMIYPAATEQRALVAS